MPVSRKRKNLKKTPQPKPVDKSGWTPEMHAKHDAWRRYDKQLRREMSGPRVK